MRAVSQPPELDKAARIKLIKKALTDCRQAVTKEAVARQYYRETHERLGGPEAPGGKLPEEET